MFDLHDVHALGFVKHDLRFYLYHEAIDLKAFPLKFVTDVMVAHHDSFLYGCGFVVVCAYLYSDTMK